MGDAYDLVPALPGCPGGLQIQISYTSAHQIRNSFKSYPSSPDVPGGPVGPGGPGGLQIQNLQKYIQNSANFTYSLAKTINIYPASPWPPVKNLLFIQFQCSSKRLK